MISKLLFGFLRTQMTERQGRAMYYFAILTLGMNQPTDSPGVRCNLIHSQQLCDYNYIHTLSDTDLVNIIMIININIININIINF